MKTIFTISVFFALTAFASAQEIQERIDQQPTPVTQQQVEKDAKIAQQERENDEADKKAKRDAEAKKKEENKQAANIEADKSKKTSTTAGKQ